MKTRLVVIVASSLAGALLLSGPAFAQGISIYPAGTVGVDVSWPNCDALPTSVDFGIVGVSDGLGYSTNPCLAKEASQLPPDVSLYVNTGWYSGSSHVNATSPLPCSATDEKCLAYNYGWNAGLYAFSAAAGVSVKSSTWWLDVETTNTWSTDPIQNQNSLQGEYDALRFQGVSIVGVYSTTAQWNAITGNAITGNWLNHWPSWGATTVRTAKQAKAYCTGHDFTGGAMWLVQFRGKLDQDYAC